MSCETFHVGCQPFRTEKWWKRNPEKNWKRFENNSKRQLDEALKIGALWSLCCARSVFAATFHMNSPWIQHLMFDVQHAGNKHSQMNFNDVRRKHSNPRESLAKQTGRNCRLHLFLSPFNWTDVTKKAIFYGKLMKSLEMPFQCCSERISITPRISRPRRRFIEGFPS